MNTIINIVDGDYSDIQLLNNIFKTYNIQAELIKENTDNQNLGVIDVVAAFLIAMPVLNDFVSAISPALVAFINAKKATGTKKTIELISGDKKLIITDEKGDLLSEDEINKLIRKTGFMF